MDRFSALAASLSAAWNSMFPARKPEVSLAALEDLNNLLKQAADGHLIINQAAAVNRMRQGVVAAIDAEAPGAAVKVVNLLELALGEVANDPAFVAKLQKQALAAGLKDLADYIE